MPTNRQKPTKRSHASMHSERSKNRAHDKQSKRQETKRNTSHDQRGNRTQANRQKSNRTVAFATPLQSQQENRTRWPFILVGLAAIVIIIIVIIAIAVALPSSDQANQATNDSSSEDTAAATKPVKLTITFAGDCTLGTDEAFSYDSSFNSKFESVNDPSWFFENVVDIFSASDLSVVNMEGTLTNATDRQDKTYAFKGDAEFAQVLVDGDIQAASLANNHSYDYGEQSYQDTIEALEDAGIKTFGYDRIAYFNLKDVKVALIGTYELEEGLDIKDEMLSNIQKAQDDGAQIIAVFAHWGVEGEYVPDDTQIELAHDAIDAGATVVIGSHPHVLQGYEKYNGRYIIYSLGNFCFGGNSDPTDKDCLMFQQTFTVEDGKVAKDDDINVIPCTVSSTSDYNNYQPTPASGDTKEEIEAKLKDSNDAIESLSKSLQD